MNSNQEAPVVESSLFLQLLVFSLVGAAFATIYVTQPVLPVLQVEFSVSEARASLTISAVIFGIALSNLPLGMTADRYPIKPIILIGGSIIAICSFACALSDTMLMLIGTRFVQGLFIPCLTTCVAAYLSKMLPKERLNVMMGSYVSATVAGGLGGRLLGGFIHPVLHWRYAFVVASILVITATLAAWRFLPREELGRAGEEETQGFLDLLGRTDLLRIFFVAFAAFFVFSSVFNYLPFYLAAPPFEVSTGLITLMYCSYLIGMVIGPIAGALSNRVGNGLIMAVGAVIFGMSIEATLIKSLPAVASSLGGICLGFFSIHAAAVGSLNRRLESSRGRANSLYVVSYYLGGFAGITISGYAYGVFGWQAIRVLGIAMLLVPLGAGLWELITEGVPDFSSPRPQG